VIGNCLWQYAVAATTDPAFSVFSGDTGDTTTFLPQVRKLRDAFGLQQMVLVGDRGMISSASIAELRAEDFGWTQLDGNEGSTRDTSTGCNIGGSKQFESQQDTAPKISSDI
jgi:hypothetical protein